jgi:hypothetical protein
VRFRGFAASLLLASLLAGAVVALGDASLTVRVAAGILTAGVWLAGWGVVTGRHARRLPWVVLLAAGALGLLVPHVQDSSPWSPRSLHVAAVLSYGAVGVASALAALRLVGEGKALLLTFSTATALFGAEMLISPPEPVPSPEWHLSSIADPQVGIRYASNSTATMFYPDNPRGYFEQTDPTRETWFLETHAGSEAQLEHSPSDASSMRVTIARLVGDEVRHVKLQQAPFQIKGGSSYILKFRGRADAARRMHCAVGNNHEPWGKLAEAVTEGLRGTGVPVLNLKDALLRDGRNVDELQVHAIDGHPNEIAHRIAAEEIERFLRTENLLP